jgi:enamidase
LIIVAACSAGEKSTHSGQQTIALTGARLIDGRGGPVLENATVIVSGDRIVSVGAGAPTPDGATVVNLQGMTILPGLIDAHVHLGGLSMGSTPPFGGRAQTDDYAVPLARSLKYGVTTVRSVGDYLDDSLAVRDAINRGELQGPRIVAGGPSFQLKGSHPNATVWGNDPTTLAEAARMPGSAEEATRMVDELAARGVDLIKVIRASIVINGAGSGQKLPWDVVEAIVIAAHRNALKVAIHIENAEDAARASELGVDDIEHLFVGRMKLEDEAAYDAPLGAIANKGIFVTPTMIANVQTSMDIEQQDLLTLTTGNKLAKRGYDRGVKLAVGSDAHEPRLHGWALLAELVLMVNDQGIPALQAIEAATKTNSELLGLSDRIGTVESGKLADLLVVAGNPAEHITDLQNVQMVIVSGKTMIDNSR